MLAKDGSYDRGTRKTAIHIALLTRLPSGELCIDSLLASCNAIRAARKAQRSPVAIDGMVDDLVRDVLLPMVSHARWIEEPPPL